MLNVTHYGYELMGTGVYGRNRKPKFFAFELALVPVGDAQPDEEALGVLFDQTVLQEKVRPGTSYKVIRRAWTVNPDGKATDPLRYDVLRVGTVE